MNPTNTLIFIFHYTGILNNLYADNRFIAIIFHNLKQYLMNAAHFHLIINHVPVIGTSITLFILLIGIIKKSDDVKKVSVLVLILTALITIPVYLSGEKAQAKIEGNYEDVDESYIEQHEDFAYYSFIAMNITGAVGIIAMFLFRKPKTLPNSFAFLFMLMLIVVASMMGYTGNLGGKIHHPEIREDKMPWESGTLSSPDKKNDLQNKESGKTKTENKDDENKKEEDD